MSITLPRITCLEHEAAPAKHCYGDWYRAQAPLPPPPFIPNDYTLAEREKQSKWRPNGKEIARRYRERKRLREGKPPVTNRAKIVWTPEMDQRLVQLVDDGTSRREAGRIIGRETGLRIANGTVIRRYKLLKS